MNAGRGHSALVLRPRGDEVNATRLGCGPAQGRGCPHAVSTSSVWGQDVQLIPHNGCHSGYGATDWNTVIVFPGGSQVA
jgi:hypothetical protein